MGKNKLFSIIFCFFMLSLLSALSANALSSAQMPKAVQGKIDFSSWDEAKSPTISLDGEWEFYYSELLEPDYFANNEKSKPEYFVLPNCWNGRKINNVTLDSFGYATYRLTIENLTENTIYGISAYEIFSSYKLYIDNELVIQSGNPSASKQSYKAASAPKTGFFKSGKKNAELVLQVANFGDVAAGVSKSITFGRAENILTEKRKAIVETYILIGSILIMGIYHIALFCLRPKDKSTLYFGLFCLTIFFRGLLTGERLLYELLHFIDNFIFVRIEFITVYLACIWFLLFLRELYPEEADNRIKLSFIGANILFMILAIFVSPVSTFIRISNSVYTAIILLMIFWFVFCVIFAVSRKKDGSIIFLFGFLFLAITALNDLLAALRVIKFGYVLSIGLFVFILSQSFLLSKKFSKAFIMEEKYSIQNKKMYDKIKSVNKTLEIKVAKRTDELTQKVIELERAEKSLLAAKKEIEEFNRGLEKKVKERTSELQKANTKINKLLELKTDFINQVAHDLRTPLTPISVLLPVIKEQLRPKLTPKDIERMDLVINNSKYLTELVQDTLNVAKLEAGRVSFEYKEENIYSVVSEVIQNNIPAFEQFKVKAVNNISRNLPLVKIDKARIIEVLHNLVRNATQFMEGQKKELVFDAKLSGRFITVSVADTGVGISKEGLSKIFADFQKLDPSRHEHSSGLGLSICRRIIEKHGGKIWAESPGLGKGTTIKFTLPIK